MADAQEDDPGTNATFHEATSTTHTVAQTAEATARADTYTVQIIARLNDGKVLYDTTVAGRFGDPLVLDAVAAAKDALTAAGGEGTKFEAPELTKTSTRLTGTSEAYSDMLLSQNGIIQDAYVTTIGPANIRYGDLGVVAKVPETSAELGALTSGTPFFVVAGGMDITHILNTALSVLRTNTTTSTYLTADVYEIDGFANRAPQITSNGGKGSASLSLAENKKAVATFSAADIDGDKLVWSLSGKDAKLFSIDAKSGALSFKAAPDFEVPQDAGKNNVYDVTVKASDGKLTDKQDIAVKVTNVVGATRTGNDKPNKLVGTTEEDKITGGKGADKLYAGVDKATDVFVFNTGDSGTTAATWDQVFDFRADTIAKLGQRSPSSDRIDLHMIDADPARGDQDLRFVSKFASARAGQPDGQVMVTTLGKNSLVHIDWDGNGKDDMVIQVMNVVKLTADDFLL